MFLELMNHAFAMDLQWIAGLVLGNLHWVFLLAAYIYITKDGKNWFWSFIFLVGSLYIALDLIMGIWGLEFFHAGKWVMVAIPLEIFIAETWFDRHKNFTIWFAFISVSFIATFFLLG